MLCFLFLVFILFIIRVSNLLVFYLIFKMNYRYCLSKAVILDSVIMLS